MIIRNLNASFGRLKNDRLELKEGLNIIEAPNEAGKSTWSAFIRAMLYGINTAQRNSGGELADKNRYQPWDGGPMAGTMEVTAGGRDITLARAPQGHQPFKAFSAHYTGSGEAVEGLSAQGCGEALTGVSEAVFTRTAFLRQAGIRVDGDPDLEKRIAAMVSSGEENRSYAQADGEIRGWMRERKFNRSGSIPRLEAESRILTEKLQKLESLSATMGEYRQNIQRLEEREKGYLEDLEKYQILEEQAAKQRVLDLKKRAENDRENYENAEKDLTRDGKLIEKAELDGLRADLAAIGERAKMLKEAPAARERAEAEAMETAERLGRSPFRGKDQQELAGIVAQARELEEAALNPPRKKRPVWQLALYIALLVLGAAGAALCFVLLPRTNLSYVAPGLVAAGLGMAAGLVLLLRRPGPSEIEEKRYQEFMALYGFDTAEEFTRAADTYGAAVQRGQTQRAAAEMAAANEESCARSLEEAQRSAAIRARRLIPQVKTAADIPAGIRELEAALDRLGRLKLLMLSSRNTYETLRDEMGGDPEEVQFIAAPMRTLEDTQAALGRCREQLLSAREKLAITQGEQRSMGDPLLLEGEKLSLEEEKERLANQYEALELAAQALKEADGELQSRFSPILSARAGAYMDRLTGGKYGEIVFAKDFSALVRPRDDAAEHPLAGLSAGTRDQAYLALRLALIELTLSGEEKCPVVLDDALTNFDDGRMEKAMELLTELAAERQILLFTCHSREADWAEAHAPQVNIIRSKAL